MPFSRPSVALATLFVLACQVTSIAGAVFNCVGGTVYVIAHADDDLLFQSPDLLTDMKSGSCVTTVIMTAGDSGTTGQTYSSARESGNQAAYAQMSGVGNTYTEVTATLGGQPITVRSLKSDPRVQKVYFRLPDGNMDGSGFGITGYQSLRMLYFGSISSITNQPKTATFTLSTLKQALGEIITARQPSFVRTLDYMSDYDAGDHADHLTVGRLTNEVAGTYAKNATVAGYMGYPVQNLPPTMDTSDSDFQGKSDAFFAYTPYDSAECQAYSSCVAAGRGETYWLQRQYIVNEYIKSESYMGTAQAPVTLPNGTNIAGLADVTASSQWAEQPATAAVDGNIRGYPGNSSAEWSAYGTTVGSWIQLQWDDPYTVTSIVLNDRPNLNDWITGATLTFADNSTVAVGALANDGSATLVDLGGAGGSVITDSIFFYVTSVSSSTGQAGLAEFQVFGTICKGCEISSNLSSTTTTTTSEGTVAGHPSTENLALKGTATASSFFDAQGPEKAIDGYIDGYKEDGTGISTEEWASYGETVGAWLNISWPAYYLIDSLVLYDRPNSNDWITGGVVKFSDGNTLPVTSLDNKGGATVFNLSSPVNASSLLFTVNSAGPSSGSVGLAELEAYYSLPQTPVNVSTAGDTNRTTTLPIAGDFDDESWADDLALLDGVEATASSLVDGQDPGNAINGDPNGYKEDGSGDPYQEWATRGEKAGAWIQLTWPYAIQVSQVTLFDRPNLSDNIKAGRLHFSDGQIVSIGALNNDGTATNFSIANVVTTSIKFTVTSASSETSSVGLSEFAVFGSIPTVYVPSVSLPLAFPHLHLVHFRSNGSTTNSTTASDGVPTLVNSTVLTNSTLLNSTILANSTALNSTSLLNSTLLNSTALSNSSLVNSTSPLNSTNLLNSTLLNSTTLSNSTLFNSTLLNSTALSNSSIPALNQTLYNSTLGVNSSSSSLYNLTQSALNTTGSALNSTGSALTNGTSSLLNSTTSGASSLLSSMLPSSTKNASSALPSSTVFVSSSAAYNLSSTASASSTALAFSTAKNASASAVPTASFNLSQAIPSASASVLLNSSSSVGFTTSTRSASAVSSTISSIASSLSSVQSSASSVISSANSSTISSVASSVSSVQSSASSAISSAASKASSAISSASSGMVVSTRVSSASSTAVSSSAVASSTSAAATGLPTAPAQGSTVNIARITGVKVTASSHITKSPPAGAIDGNIGGVSLLGLGNAAQEWVANGVKGEWIELDWPQNYLMQDIVLYGRVNSMQGIASGVLNFTDGTVIKVGALSSSGSHVSLGSGITVSGVRFTVMGGTLTTTQAGLAELSIYHRPAPSFGLVGSIGNAVGQTLGGILGTFGL
ncbi:hypothetical protein JCM11251_007199 [Rhodosporidiobolus azoricus]